RVTRRLTDAFVAQDLNQAGSILQDALRETYSLTVLFRDEQRKILNEMIEGQWSQAGAAFSDLYPSVITMIQTLLKVGAPDLIPRAFYAAAEFALNTRLRNAIARDDMDFEAIRSLIADASAASVPFDAPTLEFTLRLRLERMAEEFGRDPRALDALKRLDAV